MTTSTPDSSDILSQGTWLSLPARQIVLLCAVALQINFDLVAIPACYVLNKRVASEFPAIMMFGFILGQTSVLTQYLAWGTDRLLVRWLKSCSILILMWAAVTVGALSCEDSFEIGSIETFLAIVVAGSFCFISIPYWAIWTVRRSRLELVPIDPRYSASWPYSHMLSSLTWGTVTAMLFVILSSKITREAWKHLNLLSGGDWVAISLWMSLWSLICVMLAIPTAWVCLHKCYSAQRVGRIAVYAVLLVAIECTGIYALGIHIRGGLWMIVLNLGIVSQVIVWSVLLRFCGYRLQV